MTIGRIDSSSNTVSNTVSLMDLDQQLSLSPISDSGAEIAALLVLGARDSRNQAKAAAQADDRLLTQLEDAQVDELYEQADATRAAGWAKGMGQIVSGGATILGTGVAAADGGPDGKMVADIWAGEAAVVQGGLNMAASEFEFEANVSAADATDAANAAKHVERHLQQLQEEQSDASQLVRTAIQTASDLSRAQTAADQATIFLRG